jgi:hypothetical protein
MQYSFATNFGGPYIPINATWDELIEVLFQSSFTPRYRADKTTSEVLGGFILRPGSTRRLTANIERMSEFICIDVDRSHWEYDDFKHYLRWFDFVAYSTASSTMDVKRWRVIVRLNREHTMEEHYSVWRYLYRMLLKDPDRACSDPAHIFFMPSDWTDGIREFHHHAGIPLAVEACTAIFPPRPLLSVFDEVEPSRGFLEGSSPPTDDPIITPHMVAKFRSEAPGGRFYRMLVRAAIRYKARDWRLDVDELARAAELVSNIDTLGNRRRPKHEAKNAIGYVERNWPQFKAELDARDQQRQAANDAAMTDALKRWGIK